jgi:ribosome-binding factor A
MSTHQRPERVSQQLADILANLLRQGVRDPRVTPLTITRVRMSPDLRVADINVVPLGGDGDGEELIDGLESATGYLRRQVGRQLRLRHTPELRFHLDTQLDEAIHMTRLLDRMASEREE